MEAATASSGVGAYRCASRMMATASQSEAMYPSRPQSPLTVPVSSQALAHAGTPLISVYAHMTQVAPASTTQLRNGGLNVSSRSCAVTRASKLYRAAPFQSSRSYAVACLQQADACSGEPEALPPCTPRTKATAYRLATAGSSPGVS
jgi:hypothetical protein